MSWRHGWTSFDLRIFSYIFISSFIILGQRVAGNRYDEYRKLLTIETLSAVPCSQHRPLSELMGIRLPGRGVAKVWSFLMGLVSDAQCNLSRVFRYVGLLGKFQNPLVFRSVAGLIHNLMLVLRIEQWTSPLL